MQLSGEPGRRTLLITASGPDRIVDSCSIEVEVLAADWLYNYFYNVAYQITGAGGVFLTDAASDLANQVSNTFAFDWTGWNDTYDDESKDSDRWTNPGVGRAVSPDNIMNWDKPTDFDGKTVHGLYGFTEPLIYRQPTRSPILAFLPTQEMARPAARLKLGLNPASLGATPRQVGFVLALIGFELGLYWLCLALKLA